MVALFFWQFCYKAFYCSFNVMLFVWQDLMEKTITLALATGQKRFSASLSKLVENYAELLASQGLLSTAMEYLKLLGSDGSSQELTILRERIEFSAERGKNFQAGNYLFVYK
jgi:hypothetical protein